MSSVSGNLRPAVGEHFDVEARRHRLESHEEPSYIIKIAEYHDFQYSAMYLEGTVAQLREVSRRIQLAVSQMERLNPGQAVEIGEAEPKLASAVEASDAA